MRRETLKRLVKEIISSVHEMHDDYNVMSDDIVEISGIPLPNGRKITVDIEFQGNWDNDGFDYEHGMDKGTHNMGSSFNLGKKRVLSAKDSATEENIPVTPEINELGLKEFAMIEDDVVEAINQNAPRDSYGDPESRYNDGNEYDPSDDM